MKKTGRLFLVVTALVALFAAFFCLHPAKTPRLAREDARPSINDSQNSGKVSVPASLPVGTQSPAVATKSPVAAFNSWTEKYLAAATEAEKQALIAQGEELAKARLAEMYELIKTNPKQALASAIPYEQRKR